MGGGCNGVQFQLLLLFFFFFFFWLQQQKNFFGSIHQIWQSIGFDFPSVTETIESKRINGGLTRIHSGFTADFTEIKWKRETSCDFGRQMASIWSKDWKWSGLMRISADSERISLKSNEKGKKVAISADRWRQFDLKIEIEADWSGLARIQSGFHWNQSQNRWI